MLSEMYSDKQRVLQEVDMIEQTLIETQGKDVSYGDLFGIYFRRQLLVGCVLKAAQVLSGYSALMIYSTSIFEDKDSPNSAKYATVLIGAANLISVSVTSFFIDSKERSPKPLL
jgi:hypothetical protein